jgi:crotonobetainyl-CoA:carnitine CoA-transferase CaiB-like acyl-CoA transferase
MGAEVVRIERDRPSYFWESDDLNLNRNKRSVFLDPRTPDGLDSDLSLIDPNACGQGARWPT